MTIHEHQCFEMGMVAGAALSISIGCVFAWLFITYTEGSFGRLAGRAVRRWRRAL